MAESTRQLSNRVLLWTYNCGLFYGAFEYRRIRGNVGAVIMQINLLEYMEATQQYIMGK
jgi:hypothetical protein